MDDPFSALLLVAALAGVGLYALYVVVRRAVRDGIRDASVEEPTVDQIAEFEPPPESSD